jgi:HNH endonuclease
MEFLDKATMTSELAIAACTGCGSIGASMTVVLGEAGPHFARTNCKNCGAFIEWVKYPEAAPKNDRRKSRKKLRDLADRCEICLRHRHELPAADTLETHHVLEVAADNGTDDPANLRRYCTACHSMVNWLRTYFGHYTTGHAAPANGRAEPQPNTAPQAD